MRKTWVLRRLPSGPTIGAPVPKSTWASSPGPHSRRRNGKLARRLQATDEAADAVVAAREAVFGGQILVDALGAEAQVALGLDHLPPGLALALATVALVNSAPGANWGAGHLGSAPVSRDHRSRWAHWLVLTPDSAVSEPVGALAGFGADSACLR